MATDTFTWCVQVNASEEIKVSSLQAQFGDGYKQVAENGINSAAQTWTLSCNGKLDDMKPVRAFLKSHVTASFWWVNPWGEQNLYRVTSDSIKPTFVNGNFVGIAFVFEQAFAP